MTNLYKVIKSLILKTNSAVHAMLPVLYCKNLWKKNLSKICSSLCIQIIHSSGWKKKVYVELVSVVVTCTPMFIFFMKPTSSRKMNYGNYSPYSLPFSRLAVPEGNNNFDFKLLGNNESINTPAISLFLENILIPNDSYIHAEIRMMWKAFLVGYVKSSF